MFTKEEVQDHAREVLDNPAQALHDRMKSDRTRRREAQG